MESIWEKGTARRRFGGVRGNMRTDVLIVGGGIAGILCAYQLKNAGVDCVLAEAGEICGGVTGNTTAKITLQHGLLYDSMIRRFGESKARLYAEAQEKACREYARLCRTVDCDCEARDSYVYSLSDRKQIEKEVAALCRIGVRAELSDARELPFSVAGAVRVKDQAQFHPLKFLYHIARDLPICEHTKIVELMPHKARTDHGDISYNKLIVATHFPILNKHGSYFLKLYQHRSYCLALENTQTVNGMYVDESKTGLSFRSHDGLLILGGGSHRTGKQGGNWDELEAFATKHYPGAKLRYRWATQDCMTLDDVPYIGQYSARAPDLYVATGFNKWGMTSSMVAANVLTDLVTGKENPYADVFSPSRSILRPQLAINSFEAVTNLLSFTKKRCPHMGCSLKWNPQERTWDCPCHGSRFEENGKLIDNPATGDLKS